MENLITGSLADDDVAMGGHHVGSHRPSGSTGGGGIAGRPVTLGGDAWPWEVVPGHTQWCREPVAAHGAVDVVNLGGVDHIGAAVAAGR